MDRQPGSGMVSRLSLWSGFTFVAVVPLMLLMLLAVIRQTGAEVIALSSEKEKILAFADHLFETGEYYRAITEYSRFLFFFPDDPLIKLVRLKVAYAYQKGEQWEDAGKQFEILCRDYQGQDIGREACFQSAETLRLGGHNRQAITRYRQFMEAYPEDDDRVSLAFFRTGCLHLELQEWQEAASAFSAVKSDSRLFTEAAYLGREARRLAALPLKKPVLAGILSAAIPGAGQIYARRYRDGATALLVNGGFIWGAAEAFDQNQHGLGSILLVMEFGWYAGNIYSAINSTAKLNQRTLEKNLAPLLERCSFSLGIRESTLVHKQLTGVEKYRLSFDFRF
ncbi:MAG: tetratricopeptide repeat protein [bacterium]